MKIQQLRRLSLTSILVVSVLVGILFGTTGAFASVIDDELSVGLNYISGIQDESPYWSYRASNYQYMYSGQTEVYVYNTHYWDGEGDDWDPLFQTYWIYDQDSNDSQLFWDFWGFPIDGCDVSYSCAWTMDELDSENEWVFCHQYVSWWAGMFSDYILTDTHP